MITLRTIALSMFFGALIGGGLMETAIARSDTPDSEFVMLLGEHNIQVDQLGFLWAHQICGHLDNGSTPSIEAGKVYGATNSSMDMDKSEWFTAAAIVVYCPWHEATDHLTQA